MVIPKVLLKKTNKFRGRIEKILGEGWKYLQYYFKDEGDYFDFLIALPEEQYEKFLRTIFFYWAHDFYRLGIKNNSSIEGFMYQITLSIIEYLNKKPLDWSKKRIKDFFGKYFFDLEKISKNNKKIITARPLEYMLPEKNVWEILYDMRNGFIHRAEWFTMRFENSFASLIKTEGKDEKEYLADVRISLSEYLKLFWKAYLRYFEKQID